MRERSGQPESQPCVDISWQRRNEEVADTSQGSIRRAAFSFQAKKPGGLHEQQVRCVDMSAIGEDRDLYA